MLFNIFEITATPDTPKSNNLLTLEVAMPPIATTGMLVFKIIFFRPFSPNGLDASFLVFVLYIGPTPIYFTQSGISSI